MNKPTIPDVIDKFIAYRNNHLGTWGMYLHVILDDNNVRDCFVLRTIEDAVERGDKETEDIARLLYSMSTTQRLKIANYKWDRLDTSHHNIKKSK